MRACAIPRARRENGGASRARPITGRASLELRRACVHASCVFVYAFSYKQTRDTHAHAFLFATDVNAMLWSVVGFREFQATKQHLSFITYLTHSRMRTQNKINSLSTRLGRRFHITMTLARCARVARKHVFFVTTF